MQQHAVINNLHHQQPHIIVLAGDKPVADMLVFIMYRKLKSILNAGTEPGAVNQKEKRL